MQAVQKRWRVLPHDQQRVEQLLFNTDIPGVVAQLLVGRGVYQSDLAQQFLDTKLSDLRDPFQLPGVTTAVELLAGSIRDGKSIVVYGDYDADGMTSTAILYNGMKRLGADVSYHVPNRLDEGYGLSVSAIEKLAARGKEVIVTVDCGITNVAEALRCKQLGVTLIVTDHHQMSAQLPEADAIVHPRLPGSGYPFGELCGAGVAFKLAWALCQEMCGSKRVTDGLRDYLMQALALAAIGTVADVVPLLDENRVMVRHGLRSLKARPLPGLAELMKRVGVSKREQLSSEDIAFSIAPRLNAAGRLGQAQLGVELLTTESETRAEALAEYIDQLNSNRQTLERSVYLAAHRQAKDKHDLDKDSALVLAGTGWHLGVIGVVAGRLAEKYHRPALVLSMDAVNGRPAVGSGRAGTDMVNLLEALSDCSEYLVRFGGHKAAAGLTIEEVHLDEFRSDFCNAVESQLTNRDTVPEVVIDAEAGLGQLTRQVVRQMEQLAPFGAGNPRPILCASGVRLAEPSRRMGGGDRHLAFRLTQDGITLRGVAFGQGDWCDDLNANDGLIDVAFRPVINDFRGYQNVEMHLVDWRPARRSAAVG